MTVDILFPYYGDVAMMKQAVLWSERLFVMVSFILYLLRTGA